MPFKKATSNTKSSLSMAGTEKCSLLTQAAGFLYFFFPLLQPTSYFSLPESQQFSVGSALVLHLIKAIFKMTTANAVA